MTTMIVLTAIAAMMSATLIQHLGLAKAISNVTSKIASCNQCCTFWMTLFTLLYCQQNFVVAVMLSIIMAYASNWFILLLIYLQRLFTRLYEKGKEEKR